MEEEVEVHEFGGRGNLLSGSLVYISLMFYTKLLLSNLVCHLNTYSQLTNCDKNEFM